MGKRSNYARFPRDFYDTPAKAVAPLLPHLTPCTRFIEPCAGAGYLVGHLESAGHVLVGAYDLPNDARSMRYEGIGGGAVFVTNPPWSRPVLHPIINNLSDQAPTWLLIDADWVHTKQAIPYLPRLQKIVSIGRVRWIPDSPDDGKDKACWHLFDRSRLGEQAPIHFIGRIGSARAASSRRAE